MNSGPKPYDTAVTVDLRSPISPAGVWSKPDVKLSPEWSVPRHWPTLAKTKPSLEQISPASAD